LAKSEAYNSQMQWIALPFRCLFSFGLFLATALGTGSSWLAQAKVKIEYQQCEVRSFNKTKVTILCGKQKTARTIKRSYYEKSLGQPKKAQPSLFPVITGAELDLKPRRIKKQRKIRQRKRRKNNR